MKFEYCNSYLENELIDCLISETMRWITFAKTWGVFSFALQWKSSAMLPFNANLKVNLDGLARKQILTNVTDEEKTFSHAQSTREIFDPSIYSLKLSRCNPYELQFLICFLN